VQGLSTRAASTLREVNALLERGDLRAAESALLVAHFRAPGHPEVLRLSGMVQYRQDRLKDAIDSFTQSLAARPDDPTVLTWLGATQSDLCDFREALGSLREALRVAADPDALLNLGIEFARQSHSEDALAAADRVLDLQPGNGLARMLRAQSRQALGDVEGAAADYRALIAMGLHVNEAWFALVDLKTVRLNPEELIALERAADSAASSEPERTMLAFALGRAYDDAGRYRDAFAAFERGNAAVRAARGWDSALFTRQVDAVCAAFAGPVAHSPPELGGEIIFLVGMPRSGTTLFEQVLAAHPRVEGAGELPCLGVVLREESNRRKLPFPEWVASATGEDWERMGRQYLRLSSRWRMERPVSTDKLPENWLLAGAALAMLPGAKLIDCRRDPLETCWSCYKQLFGSGRVGFTYDLEALAVYWHDYDRLCRFWAERHPSQVRVQRYEAFLADPEAETRALLQFCGLDFDARCLRFHEARRSIRGASAAQVREPLRRDAARAGNYAEWLASLRAALEVR
jgi:tetratricopeptide (TPR) repeat protein